MAESALIYLAPGAFSRYRDAGLEEATVLYQAGAGETPERLTLAQRTVDDGVDGGGLDGWWCSFRRHRQCGRWNG